MMSRIRNWGEYFNNLGFRLALWYTITRFLMSLNPLVSSMVSIAIEVFLILALRRNEVSSPPEIHESPKDFLVLETNGLSYCWHETDKKVEVLIEKGMMVIEND
ncbi:MAG: hypothetical protein D6732_04090 [Methanobacteriota archaeon]|nr:MAG: hypothetical protein D6732_04090 [Euryarchaeota archaeon]